MVERDEITAFLDRLLDVRRTHDAAQNGLQVEGRKSVRKIAFGVSASEQLFEAAARAGADMVIVHHGLFWSSGIRVVGPMKKRLSVLLENDISLLGYHLPLDKHPLYGNNAQLLNAAGVREMEPFGVYKGEVIGFCGKLPRPMHLVDVGAKLAEFCGATPLALFGFGPEKISSIAAVSGGASDFIGEAARLGTDLFVTGEAGEPVQEFCREAGLNCLSLGHYNSEKAGVRALAALLKKKFRVETIFIDCPNRF